MTDEQRAALDRVRALPEVTAQGEKFCYLPAADRAVLIALVEEGEECDADAEEVAQGMDGLAEGFVEFLSSLNPDDHPNLAKLQPMLAVMARIHEQDAAKVRALGRRIAQQEHRMRDIADAFGGIDANDQRALCVAAREAGSKLDIANSKVLEWARAHGRAQQHGDALRAENEELRDLIVVARPCFRGKNGWHLWLNDADRLAPLGGGA